MNVLQRYKIGNSTLGACKQKIWYHSVRPRSPRPYLPVGNNNDDDDEISGMKHELTNRNSRFPRHQSQNTMHGLNLCWGNYHTKNNQLFFSHDASILNWHIETLLAIVFFFFSSESTLASGRFWMDCLTGLTESLKNKDKAEEESREKFEEQITWPFKQLQDSQREHVKNLPKEQEHHRSDVARQWKMLKRMLMSERSPWGRRWDKLWLPRMINL